MSADGFGRIDRSGRTRQDAPIRRRLEAGDESNGFGSMKLLYCSDLHGHCEHYGRLEAAARDVRPDVIVLGGDILPDDSALRPEQMGLGQPQFVREQFRRAVQAVRSACGDAPVLFIFGNHDWGSSIPAVEELAKDGVLTLLGPEQAFDLDGVCFLGYSFTPPTPWYVKDFERLDEPGDRPPLLGGARWDPRFNRVGTHAASVLFKNRPSMAEDLAEMTTPTAPWVFVAHAPPFESKLDRTFGNKPLGSRAIRATIEKRRPILSLHGHIHESPRVTGTIHERIGATVAVNAGQVSGALSLAVIEIDTSESAVKSVEHRRQS